MKTALENVKAKLEELRATKAAQIGEIVDRQKEEENEIEAASIAMKTAAADMDADKYENEAARLQRAKIKLEMFTERLAQIQGHKLVTEAESDAAIDSLLEHENKLTEEFKAAAAAPLAELSDLLEAYFEAVEDTENTMSAWQREIHANYNTRGRTLYRDENTGELTSRSPKPVPVRPLPYTGCDEAKKMKEYLHTAKALYNR